jgi:hypothetical protein
MHMGDHRTSLPGAFVSQSDTRGCLFCGKVEGLKPQRAIFGSFSPRTEGIDHALQTVSGGSDDRYDRHCPGANPVIAKESSPGSLHVGVCLPGAGYASGCDVDQEGDVDVIGVQLAAGHWSQAGAWVSDS